MDGVAGIEYVGGGYFMTPDEQLLAKGRTLQNYIDAKSKLAALTGEAQRLIVNLQSLASHIDHYESSPVNLNLVFMNPEKVQKLIVDLQQTAREKAQLEEQLKSMGVDL
jgi:hypothetical protein